MFVGLIPAHAGKTMRVRTPAARFRAHPRSRGENPIFALTLKCGCGSSPLTRGKHGRGCDYCWCERLIPAHAGKTTAHTTARAASRAHPRSRGENRPCDSHSAEIAGSSPLTRGKPGRPATTSPSRGLIPAHAGKTWASMRMTRRARAHPRSRGENGGSSSPQRLQVGSSPLTRGKPLRGLPGAGPQGLIPAHAGKTTPRNCPAWQARAHPRSRGEN